MNPHVAWNDPAVELLASAKDLTMDEGLQHAANEAPADFKGGKESRCFRILKSSGFHLEPKDVVRREATKTALIFIEVPGPGIFVEEPRAGELRQPPPKRSAPAVSPQRGILAP